MSMPYSSRGVTGKHGRSISSSLKSWLKFQHTRLARHKSRITARASYSRRRGFSGRRNRNSCRSWR